jgi:16S rRNA (cytosine1402-N4)-methyltransferase
MKAYAHVPVMLPEVEKYLAPKLGGYFLDCTLGGAGYTLKLAGLVGPTGRVLAIDLDEAALSHAKQRIKEANLDNVILVRDNFKNLSDIVETNFPVGTKFDGIVMDLGLSSAQLADEERGFSFQGEHPLDMAFGPDSARSTEEIVN